MGAPTDSDLTELVEKLISCRRDYVDLRFTDLPGSWLHFQVPSEMVSVELFKSGLNFDGSSVNGWKDINESDMIMVPDATTCRHECGKNVASFVCNIKDPVTGERYERDPRYVAQKAEKALHKLLPDTILNVGAEAEFFVFDHVEYGVAPNESRFKIHSHEGAWNSQGPKIPYKEGYFSNNLAKFRSELMRRLKSVGMTIELAHHEVGSAGQCEIGVKYKSLVKKADEMMMFKYMVKQVAIEYGYVATFMPKPLHGDNGSGMHCHQSIWNADGSGHGFGNLFAGNGDNPGFLSKTAMYYTGGILRHARALTAFTNPTTNSYKRLVPGYEAPNVLAYSSRNRSTAIRIPAANNCKGRRIEVRFPDPSCNPYLAFAAMLMAGLDGIKNEIDPGEPLDQDAFSMSKEELAKYPGELPGSLDEALVSLSGDHEFLTADNVFTWDLIKTWIEYKYDNEVDNVRTYPHPREFELYFDV